MYHCIILLPCLPSLHCLKEIIFFWNSNILHNVKIRNVSYLDNHKQGMELISEARKYQKHLKIEASCLIVCLCLLKKTLH